MTHDLAKQLSQYLFLFSFLFLFFFSFLLVSKDQTYCQGRNGEGWRSGVIDRSILQNGVMCYVREQYYLAMV